MPLVAYHPEIPEAFALQGFDAVRVYSAAPDASRACLSEGLTSSLAATEMWEARGESRGGLYVYDQAPAERGMSGPGTVHHVAWASPMDEHQAWRDRVAAAGGNATPMIDRYYFKSIYFREPTGVLFEIATLGPGFAVDEPLETLGESLSCRRTSSICGSSSPTS